MGSGSGYGRMCGSNGATIGGYLFDDKALDFAQIRAFPF
jgi:hypothetical protein